MDTSKFLSQVIGIYLIIVSTAMLFNMQHFVKNIDLLMHNPSLMFVLGFFTLILGVLMIVAHNIWQWNWRVLVTLIGWITLLKGASILFFPELVDNLSVLFVKNGTFAHVAAFIDLALGLFFIYKGFRCWKS